MSVSGEETLNEGLKEGQTPFSLTMNGQPAEGVLCFSVTGEDYIWTGLHYWEFTAALGVAIGLYLLLVYHKWTRASTASLANALVAVQKYPVPHQAAGESGL